MNSYNSRQISTQLFSDPDYRDQHDDPVEDDYTPDGINERPVTKRDLDRIADEYEQRRNL